MFEPPPVFGGREKSIIGDMGENESAKFGRMGRVKRRGGKEFQRLMASCTGQG